MADYYDPREEERFTGEKDTNPTPTGAPKHCAECERVMEYAPGIGHYCPEHGDGPAREDGPTGDPQPGRTIPENILRAADAIVANPTAYEGYPLILAKYLRDSWPSIPAAPQGAPSPAPAGDQDGFKDCLGAYKEWYEKERAPYYPANGEVGIQDRAASYAAWEHLWNILAAPKLRIKTVPAPASPPPVQAPAAGDDRLRRDALALARLIYIGMDSGAAWKDEARRRAVALSNLIETSPAPAGEPTYACADCGKLRTKAEGGTTFTVCDACWDKHYKAPASPGTVQAPAAGPLEAGKKKESADFNTWWVNLETSELGPPAEINFKTSQFIKRVAMSAWQARAALAGAPSEVQGEWPLVDGIPFDYPAAARSIALNLAEWFDQAKPYSIAIADAARAAKAEIDRLRAGAPSAGRPMKLRARVISCTPSECNFILEIKEGKRWRLLGNWRAAFNKEMREAAYRINAFEGAGRPMTWTREAVNALEGVLDWIDENQGAVLALCANPEDLKNSVELAWDIVRALSPQDEAKAESGERSEPAPTSEESSVVAPTPASGDTAPTKEPSKEEMLEWRNFFFGAERSWRDGYNAGISDASIEKMGQKPPGEEARWKSFCITLTSWAPIREAKAGPALARPVDKWVIVACGFPACEAIGQCQGHPPAPGKEGAA